AGCGMSVGFRSRGEGCGYELADRSTWCAVQCGFFAPGWRAAWGVACGGGVVCAGGQRGVGMYVGGVGVVGVAASCGVAQWAGGLLVLPGLVAIFMMLVESNAFIALGMLAVFTMIRFRNVLKDTRDTTFILWALIIGLGVGTEHFALSVLGSGAIALVYLYMRFTAFGARHHYDVIVSMEVRETPEPMEMLRTVLRRHAVRVQLAAQRELGDDKMNVSYRLLLRDPARSRELIADLRATPGVELPALFHREDESEL